MSKQQIALALSGGGYRATYYHLGVIRCLRDYGVLKDVALVTSVSGGSILAAHIALNWMKFNGSAEEFDTAAAELQNLSDSDFRNAETRMLPWRAILGRLLGNTSDGAKKTYQLKLFGEKTLGDLAGNKANPSPKLFILATDLNKPTCTLSFSSDGIRFHDVDGTKHVETNAVPVATAVAASAAFPPFFNPIRIDAAIMGAKEGQVPHQPLFAADGGVRDNSGACILRSLAAEFNADRLVISDASRSLDLDRATDYSRSRKQTLLRVLDILQTRVADEVHGKPESGLDEDGTGEKWIRITDRLDTTAYCSAQLQNDIASIRTDLDVFTEGEIAALYHLGYAQTEVSDVVKGRRTKKDRLMPFGDAIGGKIPKRLENSQKVRTRWLGIDIATVANVLVLVAALFGLGLLVGSRFANDSVPEIPTSAEKAPASDDRAESISADSTLNPPAVTTNDFLTGIENTRLAGFSYQDRNAPYKSWKDAWAAENATLLQALRDSETHRLVCVYAGGGVGKGLFINIARKEFGSENLHVVECDRNVADKLRGVTTQGELQSITFEPYLPISGFSEPFTLPAPTVAQYELLRGPDSGEQPLLVDGLDEVHPDSSRQIMYSIFEGQKAAPHSTFILARPEAFWFFFSKYEAKQKDAEFHKLLPPAQFYSNSCQILLADLREFKTVTSSTSFVEAFQGLLGRSAVVRSSIGTTSIRNFVFESLSHDAEWANLPMNLSVEELAKFEEDFREKAYNAILDYNRISHGRPSSIGGASDLSTYRRILHGIAHAYSSSEDVDAYGWFTPTGEPLSIKLDSGQIVEIDVPAFLRLSGLVEVKPTYIKSPQFRFTPAWMHRYLAEHE